MPSRCAPQSTLQYHTLPSNVDYNTYTHQSTGVDWRPPYVAHVGPYSPYPDDEESSPLITQPPSYMLPNTDPMSANNTYYMHGHGVRPHPSSLWSEPQQYVPQPASQLTGFPYTMAQEAPQSFQTIGTAANMLSDRTLPQPVAARSYMPTPASSIDIPVSASTQRTPSYWHSDTGTSVNQLPTPVEVSPTQEQASERSVLPYRIQDMTYGQPSFSEGISVTSASPGTYLVMNEPQPPSGVASTGNVSTRTSLSMLTSENHKPSTESSSVTFNYPNSLNGRIPQMRSSSSQLRPGPLYCQTALPPHREAGSDDCSPDCTSSQTESTRTSFTSMTSTSAGC
ncbi:hypothetical protein H2200_000090 [Cladophialophora chaetospira]|uniref:Uncharacterized protein n=1 Tax=Cladophialophora chaetospira TaxID=386627 RepID=A0AA38XMW3_9EURO|nr:hypothetical protein H2200_000090 [Cladophialophora chaetospira]